MAEILEDKTPGLLNLRVEQAKLLKQGVIKSCLIVQTVILYISAILLMAGQTLNVLVWFVPTTFMILVVYLYATFKAQNGITIGNVASYLKGHIFISCITGLVWGGCAAYILDGTSYFSLFVVCTIVTSITVGGMSPNSAYRPGYVGLATCCLVPFALYWLWTVQGPVRLVGIGLLFYYGLGMFVSAQAEINMRDVISARETNVLTEKLKAQNAAIKFAHDEKTRFLAATSHDLSQPLHAQGYFIQSLRKTLKDKAQMELLDKVEASWRNQSQLLQGIVDITRMDSGAIIAKPKNIDLNKEVSRILPEFDEAIKAKSINLTSDIESIGLYTDPVLLGRILRNLIANAIKFTPENGRIDVQSISAQEQVKIVISDTGIGIAKSEHERVFEEYIRLNPHIYGDDKGLGLGLSIVRKLTNFLNIQLELDSDTGRGTSITLTVPIDNKASEPIDITQPINARLVTSPLIVLVDDEQHIREGMTALLTDWGCQVICASSGNQIINLISETLATPSLLIIDKRLANEESGIDLINRLREEVNETVPAILMTGDLTGFGDLKAEADIQLMTKPVDPNEIRRFIDNIGKAK